MTPIFVPSKNRAGKIKFYSGAIYVVEMQDYNKARWENGCKYKLETNW
jgi:hypothetical protein